MSDSGPESFAVTGAESVAMQQSGVGLPVERDGGGSPALVVMWPLPRLDCRCVSNWALRCVKSCLSGACTDAVQEPAVQHHATLLAQSLAVDMTVPCPAMHASESTVKAQLLCDAQVGYHNTDLRKVFVSIANQSRSPQLTADNAVLQAVEFVLDAY